MAFFTDNARAFQRQLRLVCHDLEVFLHLQEMDFRDPRTAYDGMIELVNQMVRRVSSIHFLAINF